MDIIPEITISNNLKISKNYISNSDIQSFIYRLDDSFVTTVSEDDEFYYLGPGCLSKLKYDKLIDLRTDKSLQTPVQFTAKLHPAQQRTLDKFLVDGKYQSGILKAKCGWGKAFLGIKMICASQEPTMVLVHTKLLQDQWVQLLKDHTDCQPGSIGDGIYNPKEITVGLYLSVNNRINELKNSYTRIIVDETHRCGSELFSQTLNAFNAKYKVGMSATPTRRDGKHVLFPDYFSDSFIEAEEYRSLIRPFVEIKRVPLRFDVLNPTTDWARALTKAFGSDMYLNLIADDVNNLISDGRTCLVLAPRVEALKHLQTKITRSVTLTGQDKNRSDILDQVGKSISCVLSTTIFDEGLSCHPLDTLVLTEPIGKNFGKLEQRIGRIQRELPDKQPALLQVYWLDNHILAKQQNIEYMWYQAQGYQTRLS